VYAEFNAYAPHISDDILPFVSSNHRDTIMRLGVRIGETHRHQDRELPRRMAREST
jgi:hypothetical protein